MTSYELAKELLEFPEAQIFTSEGVEVTDFFIQEEDLYIDTRNFDIVKGSDISYNEDGHFQLVIPKGSIVLE